MEVTTRKPRTREEVRAAFREYMRKKKEYEEEAIARLQMLKMQGFFGN